MSAAAGAAAAAKPSLPTAVIVMGVSGSGKSTIGMGLARALGWDAVERRDQGRAHGGKRWHHMERRKAEEGKGRQDGPHWGSSGLHGTGIHGIN